MPNVGYATMQIIPSVRGIAGEIRQQISAPMEQAGRQAGQAGGGAASGSFLGKFGGALKAGVAGVAVAAGALLAKGFGDAMEQGKITGRLKAQLGATGPVAKQYGQVAGKLYSSGVTEDFQSAADAIRATMSSGLVPPGATTAQIQTISTKVSDLASTFEVDLGQAANATGQIVKTGLAKNAGEALDVLTRGFQTMGPRADDLGDTFNEYSTIFRGLGLSATSATGLISQGMKAGARDTDTVADALKEFQIRATDGSKASAAGFQALGLDAQKMTSQIAKGGPEASKGLGTVLDKLRGIKDPAERSQAAVALFGTKAEDLGQALYALDPSTAVSALGQVGGAADEMGNSLRDNASTRIESFKRTAMQGITNLIGNYVLPPLTKLADILGKVLGPALDGAKKLFGGLFSSLGGAGGGGALTSLGKTFSDLGQTVATTLGPAFDKLQSTFTTTLLPALSKLWSVVGGQLLPTLVSVGSAVAGAVLPILARLGSILIGTVWPAAMKIYAAIAENLAPIFAALSDFIQQRVVPAVKTIGAKLQELVTKAQPVIDVVSKIAVFLGTLAAKILGTVIPIIIRLAGPIFSLLFGAIGTAISWVGNIIGWVGKFLAILISAPAKIGKFISSGLEAFGRFASGVGGRIGDAIAWVAGLPIRAVAALASLGGRLLTTARNAFGKLRSGAAEKAGALLDYVRGLPGRAVGALGDIGSKLYSAGSRLLSGFIQGIKDKIASVKDTLGGLTDKLTSWKGPPSKDARLLTPAGRLLIDGLMAGIDDRVPLLRRQLTGLTGEIGAFAPAVGLGAAGAARPSLTTAAAGGGSAVTIHEFHAHAGQSPDDIARSLQRQSKARG